MFLLLQRSYVKNAVLNLNTTGPHGAFRAEILDALSALSPTQLAARCERTSLPLRFSEVESSFVKTSSGQAPKNLKKREAVFAGVRRQSRSSSSSQRKSRGNPTTARGTMRPLLSHRMARLHQSALMRAIPGSVASLLAVVVVGGSGRCGTRRSRSTILRCLMSSTRPTLNAPTRPKAQLRTSAATTSQSL